MNWNCSEIPHRYPGLVKKKKKEIFFKGSCYDYGDNLETYVVWRKCSLYQVMAGSPELFLNAFDMRKQFQISNGFNSKIGWLLKIVRGPENKRRAFETSNKLEKKNIYRPLWKFSTISRKSMTNFIYLFFNQISTLTFLIQNHHIWWFGNDHISS